MDKDENKDVDVGFSKGDIGMVVYRVVRRKRVKEKG